MLRTPRRHPQELPPRRLTISRQRSGGDDQGRRLPPAGSRPESDSTIRRKPLPPLGLGVGCVSGYHAVPWHGFLTRMHRQDTLRAVDLDIETDSSLNGGASEPQLQLRWSTSWLDRRWIRVESQMREDPHDHRALGDHRHETATRTTHAAPQHLETKHPPHQLRP
jgi:hypothetical protein